MKLAFAEDLLVVEGMIEMLEEEVEGVEYLVTGHQLNLLTAQIVILSRVSPI